MGTCVKILDQKLRKMKLFAAIAATVSFASGTSLEFEVIKESGLTQKEAQQDCQSRGKRLATIYSQDEQDLLNEAITAAGGLERAFWLGMFEDGEVADGDAAYDVDGEAVGFNGFRSDQPSNKLNHPNDKHTTGLYEDCIRQFGLEGWNDAICTRTWSGAKRDNVLMGHICENRQKKSSVYAQEFAEVYQDWITTFLPKTDIQEKWNGRVKRFKVRVHEKLLKRNCAVSIMDFAGFTSIDGDSDALQQLNNLSGEMKTFLSSFLSGCQAILLSNLDAKMDRWDTRMSTAYNKFN